MVCFVTLDKSSKHFVTCDKQMHKDPTNHIKRLLNATRSKSPHLCFTSVAQSHISASFAPRPAVLVLAAILSAPNDPKWPFPKLDLFRSFACLFKLQVILRQMHQTTRAQKDRGYYKVKGTPHKFYKYLPESQISLRCAVSVDISQTLAIFIFH